MRLIKFTMFCCSFLAAMGALQLATLVGFQTQNETTYKLKPGTINNFKVETRMEVKGTLYLDPTEKTRSVTMNVNANYQYGERLAVKPNLIKAIRYYDQAQSNIELSTGSTKASLDPANRYLILEWREDPVADKRIRFQSPQPTLTEMDLNLINVPANTMLLSRWLENSKIKVDESWTTDAQMLADALTWDHVDENEITARLAEVTAEFAKIQLSGKAKGTIDGAASEATIQGTCLYHLRQGYVSHVRLKISENRDAGIVAPGYEATIWLESKIAAATQTRLTNAALGQLKMNPASRADQLLLTAKCGPYQLAHQRHWRMIDNRKDRTVLRCIKNGAVLAQCDIVPLPNQPKGSPVSLEHFQLNVQKALTNSNGEIVNREQSPSISQQKWMRIDAVGETEEMEMRWIYCTVTAPDLRRVQLLFTLEDAAFAEFKGHEKELIEAIEFIVQKDDASNKTGDSTTNAEATSQQPAESQRN